MKYFIVTQSSSCADGILGFGRLGLGDTATRVARRLD